MQLYKKRAFSELITDTLNFFKEYGKNYFKNYLIINGLLFLVLILTIVVGFREFISQFFNSNMGNESYLFEQYFEENAGVFIVICLLILFLFIIISVVNYAFPVVYMDKVAREGKKDFTSGEILSEIKSRIGKIIVFILLGFFILMPIILIVIVLNLLLVFIIIGIPLMFIVFPTIMNITNLTLFDYLLTKNSYFTSLSNAFKIQFSKSFWKYLGASFIVYMIIQFVTSIFSFIPGFLMGVSSATIENSGQTMSDSFSYIVIILYTLSIVVSLIASNGLYICTGFIYYDSREDLQREVHFDEIDSIGQNV